MTVPKVDIKSLTQLGDQLSEAIAKIEPNVMLLQDATKHIESLKILPQTMQDSIQAVSKKCAETLVKDMTSKIDKRVHDILQPLDLSAQYALRALQGTKLRKRMRMAGFISLSLIIAALIGFGGGYYFGCQRIILPAGVKLHSYPITSPPQPSSKKSQNVGKGAKKNDPHK